MSETGMGGGARRGLWWAMLAAVLVTVALRAPYYLRKQVFNVDEGTLAAVAGTVLDGGLPYRDSWDTRGPMTFLLYAGTFAVAGRNNMLAVHLLTMAAVALSSLLLMLLGRRLGRPGVGLLAGVAWSAASFSYLPLDMLAANVEMFMVPLILAALLLLLGALEGGRPGLFAAPGLVLGLAFLTKQPALLDFLAAAAFVLLPGHSAPGGFGRRAARAGVLAAGFAAPLAALAAGYALAGALPDFVFQFWTYSSRYFLPAMPKAERLEAFLTGAWPMARDNAWLWLSGAAAGAAGAAGWLSRRGRVRREDLLWLWAASSYAAASYSGRAFGHYYLQFLPPLVLLSSVFTLESLPALAVRFRLHGAARGALLLSLVGFIIPVATHWNPRVLGVLGKAGQVLSRSVEERNAAGLNRPMRQLVNHLRRGAAEGDRIFVWGFQPQVYLLSGLRPASRFSYCIYLTGLVPWVNVGKREDTSRWIVPGTWDMLMSDLERSRPRYIVDTSPGNVYFWGKYPLRKFPRLKQLVDRDYVLEREIAGRRGRVQFRVWRRAA